MAASSSSSSRGSGVCSRWSDMWVLSACSCHGFPSSSFVSIPIISTSPLDSGCSAMGEKVGGCEVDGEGFGRRRLWTCAGRTAAAPRGHASCSKTRHKAPCPRTTTTNPTMSGKWIPLESNPEVCLKPCPMVAHKISISAGSCESGHCLLAVCSAWYLMKRDMPVVRESRSAIKAR